MDQLLVTRDAPKRKELDIHWRIGVRVELHHGSVARKPGWMRVSRIQGRVFQQAQAPAMRRGWCRSWPAVAVQPFEPVIGMAAQVLPGQCECIQAQDVEVGGGGIPVREMVRIGHDGQAPVEDQERRNGRSTQGSRRWPIAIKMRES